MHGVEVARVVKDYMEKQSVRRYVNQNGDGIDKESMWLVQTIIRGIDQMKGKLSMSMLRRHFGKEV